ncbi:MAG: hypothetical protein ABIG30_02420 [Candidatus Aenigmatarchaeota archaeon]
MMKLLIILIVFIVCVTAAYGLAMQGRASMQLGFSMHNAVALDDGFASAGNNSIVALIAVTDAQHNAQYDANVDGDSVLLGASQASGRFILIFTNANHGDIASKPPVPSTKYFGNVKVTVPGSSKTHVRLEYNDIDIVSRLFWGSGFHSLVIRNIGSVLEPKIVMGVYDQ